MLGVDRPASLHGSRKHQLIPLAVGHRPGTDAPLHRVERPADRGGSFFFRSGKSCSSSICRCQGAVLRSSLLIDSSLAGCLQREAELNLRWRQTALVIAGHKLEKARNWLGSVCYLHTLRENDRPFVKLDDHHIAKQWIRPLFFLTTFFDRPHPRIVATLLKSEGSGNRTGVLGILRINRPFGLHIGRKDQVVFARFNHPGAERPFDRLQYLGGHC